MPAFTREQWNEIIRNVNTLATNPDDGCDPVAPLEEVEPRHIWAKSDIEAVRSKLQEICADNQFAVELRLWSQELIDEINTAIANGWCECEQDECVCADEDILLLEWVVPITRVHATRGCGDGSTDPACDSPGLFAFEAAMRSIGAYGRGIGGSVGGSVIDGDDNGIDLVRSLGGLVWGCDGSVTLDSVLDPGEPNYEGRAVKTIACYTTQCTLTTESCFLWFCQTLPCVFGLPICGSATDSANQAAADLAAAARAAENPYRRWLAIKSCPMLDNVPFPCRECCPDDPTGYVGSHCPDPDDAPGGGGG